MLKYLSSIEVIEAQESLIKATLLDYSHSSPQDERKKLYNNLRKRANKFSDKDAKKVLSDDLPAILEGILNGR